METISMDSDLEYYLSQLIAISFKAQKIRMTEGFKDSNYLQHQYRKQYHKIYSLKNKIKKLIMNYRYAYNNSIERC